MDALEYETPRVTRNTDEALHSEDVHPTLPEQLAEPGVKLFGVGVAIYLDRDRSHRIVVLVLRDPGSLSLYGNGGSLDALCACLFLDAGRLGAEVAPQFEFLSVCIPQLDIELLPEVLGE